MGCNVEVWFNELKTPTHVVGGTCEQGRQYALQEAIEPLRLVTSYVCVEGNLQPLSVKTSVPVAKNKIFEVLGAIRSLKLTTPISVGEVLIKDVCQTGADVIATKSLPKA
jgi:CxxC motif-containing protein